MAFPSCGSHNLVHLLVNPEMLSSKHFYLGAVIPSSMVPYLVPKGSLGDTKTLTITFLLTDPFYFSFKLGPNAIASAMHMEVQILFFLRFIFSKGKSSVFSDEKSLVIIKQDL